MSLAIGTNVVLVSRTLERDPARGTEFVDVYEGTETGINSLVAGLTDDQTYTVDGTDSPKWRLIVRTPDDPVSEDSVTTWELVGNTIQKSLFEHPSLQITDEDELQELNAAVRETLNGEPVTTYPSTTTALKMYELLSRETTHFWVPQWVLRKTETVRTSASVSVAMSNVLKLHTNAQVTSAESIPVGIVFSIGSIPSQSDVNYGVAAIGGGVKFKWSWLKFPPTVNVTAGADKAQIVQEYWLEHWSTLIYGDAS